MKILYSKAKTPLYKMNNNKVIWEPGFFCTEPHPSSFPLPAAPSQILTGWEQSKSHVPKSPGSVLRTSQTQNECTPKPGLLGDVQCDTHSSPNRKVQETALWTLRLHLQMGHFQICGWDTWYPQMNTRRETSFSAKWHEMLFSLRNWYVFSSWLIKTKKWSICFICLAAPHLPFHPASV